VLGYLREAAEALDVMNLQHAIQHLDIKPDNLFLVSNHVKVADFGLADTAQEGGSRKASAGPAPGITPLYAAPERFQGRVSPSSDQYSLALVYQELLTGSLPFPGTNWRQLLLQHTNAEPDLRLLPALDQSVVAKALSKVPEQRYPSCTDFVRALTAGPVQAVGAPVHASTRPDGSESSGATAATGTRKPGGTDALCPPRPGKNCRETVRGAAPDTDAPPGANAATAGTALPGYRFLDFLGQFPLGESWKVQTPDGRLRLVKYIYGFATAEAPRNPDVLRQLQSLRHPALLRTEAVHGEAARLILVSDLAEQSLRDRFRACRTQGLPGIPRRELLGYVRAAAEVVDDLAEDHALHHWELNPSNLHLVNGRLRVADFGLVQWLWTPAGDPVGPLNPRYAAPELFHGPSSPGGDLYSLALMYQELLTGIHPHGRGTGRRAATARGPRKLDLDPLVPFERAILAQALDPDPSQRFPTCTDLVRALEAAGAPQGGAGLARGAGSAEVPAPSSAPLPPALVCLPSTSVQHVLTEMMTVLAGPVQVRESDRALRYLLYDGGVIEHRCVALLLPGTAPLKLEGFCQEWNAELVHQDGEDDFHLRVQVPAGHWPWLLGRKAGLTVQIHLRRPGPSEPLTEVTVLIQPWGCGKNFGTRLLQELAEPLLASLHAYFQAVPERRAQERLPCDYPLRVHPVLEDLSLGEAMAGRSKDISLSGMRLWVPDRPPTAQVCIQLHSALQAEALPALAAVRRLAPGMTNGYEIGVQFLQDRCPESTYPSHNVLAGKGTRL
ncbi:MAG: protein kinase, partial [Gemmataceae bacterium]|nr:protein kinase [Gemmataceae bacterium]